jgi:peptidoglycan/LPS O-acetylase OafA/YrhL
MWGFWANLGYIIVGTIATLLVSRILYEIIEKPLSAALRRQVKKYGLV